MRNSYVWHVCRWRQQEVSRRSATMCLTAWLLSATKLARFFATHCTTLQYIAKQGNTLQHAATHYKTRVVDCSTQQSWQSSYLNMTNPYVMWLVPLWCVLCICAVTQSCVPGLSHLCHDYIHVYVYLYITILYDRANTRNLMWSASASECVSAQYRYINQKP